MSIINLTFCFCFNDRTVVELRKEISEYLESFHRLYPSINMIPKMHFLTHFPDQMEKFGCLRHHATQRMEGKNGAIKKPPVQNYRNICKTISYQQEFWLVSQRLDSEWQKNTRFLSKGLEIKKPISINFQAELFEKYRFVANGNLFECNEIKSHGFKYQLEDYLIIRDNLDIKENSIGKIIKMFVADGSIVFDLCLYDIIEFLSTKNCFSIKTKGNRDIKYLNNTVHKQPLYCIKSEENDSIVQIRHFFNILR